MFFSMLHPDEALDQPALQKGGHDLTVQLAQEPGQPLMSRSQAKRVLSRFEQFRNVMLDFEDIDSLGQTFADEIFRVYAKVHPQVKLEHRNAGAGVARTIKRAQSNPA